MAKYTSKPTVVNRPAEELAAKFSDFRTLQAGLDELPEEQRAKVGDVSFTEDTIKINTPQVGEIALRATERTAGRDRFRIIPQHHVRERAITMKKHKLSRRILHDKLLYFIVVIKDISTYLTIHCNSGSIGKRNQIPHLF